MDLPDPVVVQKLGEGGVSNFYEISGVAEVISLAEHVKLGSDEAFGKAAEELSNILDQPDPPELRSQLIGPFDDLTDEEKFIWYLLMDSVNFHFINTDGQRYEVSYDACTYHGSMGAAAAINNWVDYIPKVLNADYLVDVKPEEVHQAFLDDNGTDIPLIDERINSIKTTFAGLKEVGGSFYKIFQDNKWDPALILKFILQHFPTFVDVAVYKKGDVSVEVAFCKRAQLLIADVFRNLGSLAEKPLNFDFLSAFADYRVPQVLQHYGLIVYDDFITQKIRDGFLEDDNLEIEIRAATLAACDKLSKISGRPAADMDYALWKTRRIVGTELDEKFPYHKKVSIFY